jgi:hypothetical protein
VALIAWPFDQGLPEFGMGAGAALLAGTRVWVTGTVTGLAAGRVIDVPGTRAAPAVVTLALAAAAAAIVLGTSGSRVRLLTAGLLLLAGAGLVAATAGVLLDPAGALRAASAEATGVTGHLSTGEVRPAAWPWLAMLGGLAVAAAGAAGLLRGSGWPAPSGRYDAPSPAAGTAPDGVPDGVGTAPHVPDQGVPRGSMRPNSLIPSGSGGPGGCDGPGGRDGAGESRGSGDGAGDSAAEGEGEATRHGQPPGRTADPAEVWDALSRGEDPT